MAAQEGEWNQVSRKRGRLRHIPTTAQKPTTGGTESYSLLGLRPNPSPEFTVSDIQRHHETACQDWQASQCWQVLQEILLAAAAAETRPTITKAICLGPGPFDPSNGSFAARRTAHIQTAAFRSIVKTIAGSQSCQEIKCIIQEPGFTQTDKDFCAELGLEVAETPGAFPMVDASTLVFGIHMELRTYHQALANLPAIFIGAGLDEWKKVIDFEPGIQDLLRSISEMDATYNKYSFPDLNYMFSSTTVYWRKSEEVEVPKSSIAV
ncbi:hypothetical protein B0H63DRAFT_484327 [Podospora didyma]|uniref:SRR1-like domain-containing protein n=1 Tax=Podospora didyma TaxID=330526 RepID=A0AAE0N6U9_9PEZI|nr:hypothetical protein B0H63DRAFT_484327 [Podospora didyma]